MTTHRDVLNGLSEIGKTDKKSFEGRPYDDTVCYLSVKDMANLCNRGTTSIRRYITEGILRVTYRPTKGQEAKQKAKAYFVHPEDAKVFAKSLKYNNG